MIARIALFAIWRPKLAETFLTPNASALTRLLQVRCSCTASSLVSDSVRIWKLL